MVQYDIALPWALTVVACHFVPAIFFLSLCGPWEEIVADGQKVERDFHFAREHFEQDGHFEQDDNMISKDEAKNEAKDEAKIEAKDEAIGEAKDVEAEKP